MQARRDHPISVIPAKAGIHGAGHSVPPMRKVSRDCVSGLSLARALVEITDFYLLVATAFGAREGTYLSRAVSGHDGGLVPVEDVAARLTLLPEGNDRAALA